MGESPEELDGLLSGARAGSREALGQALNSCRRYLLAIAEQELADDLRSKGGASDMVQEAFLEAQRSFLQFRGDTAEEWRAWLRVLLRHRIGKLSRTYRRTQKRGIAREVPLGAGSSLHIADTIIADLLTPSGQAMEQEEDRALEAAIARLPDEYRQVITLRYHEGRTFGEIGPLLNRSADAARKLWGRAVEHLQQELEPP